VEEMLKEKEKTEYLFDATIITMTVILLNTITN
jgi:hypothetical protein